VAAVPSGAPNPRTAGSTTRGAPEDTHTHLPFLRLPNRPLSRSLRDFDEPHTELLDQSPLEQGVVGLGHADRDAMQLPGIDRAPRPVVGQHPVADHHMGVQIRIASARIAVLERSRDEPGHPLERDPVGTDPRVTGLAFAVGERSRPRVLVDLIDDATDHVPAQRPQHLGRLDPGKDQVETADRLAGLAQLVGQILTHPLPGRCPPGGVHRDQQRPGDGLFDVAAFVDRRAPAVRLLERGVRSPDVGEQRNVVVVLVELPAQPGGLERLLGGHAGRHPFGDELIRIRPQTLTKQRQHVLFADLAGHAEVRAPRTDQTPGGLPAAW